MNKINVYKPSDDTFLLAECIKDLKGDSALDICTGSGYIAKILSKNFRIVVATDIDKCILKSDARISYICCNGASALKSRFDIITINPPYLPSDMVSDITVDGGNEGIEVTLSLMKQCINLMHEKSRLFVVSSSLSNINKLLDIEELETKIVKKKRLWFEELIVIEANLKYEARLHPYH